MLGRQASDEVELLVVEVVVGGPAVAREGGGRRDPKRRLLARHGVDDGPTLRLAEGDQHLGARRCPDGPSDGEDHERGSDHAGHGAADARRTPGTLAQRRTSHTSAAVASTKATETYPFRLKKAMSSFDRSFGRRRACSYTRSAAIKPTPTA